MMFFITVNSGRVGVCIPLFFEKTHSYKESFDPSLSPFLYCLLSVRTFHFLHDCVHEVQQDGVPTTSSSFPDRSEQLVEDVIRLFCAENLAEMSAEDAA